MNLYGQDLSVMDFNYSDYPHLINSLSFPFQHVYDDQQDSTTFNSNKSNQSPPNFRHDGKSPLPLGIDWSPPPLNWNGKDSVWPHDSSSGWSYCVTIPSWVVSAKIGGSDTVVFYRVQIGVQSPEGITTTREILRRFSDFLELLADLKKTFPKKNLPPPPPKKIMSMSSSSTALEERRCSLEGWMEKLLSDIDLSRSAPMAIFLELEAAVRSSFLEIDEQTDVNSHVNVASGNSLQSKLGVVAEPPTTGLEGNDSPCQTSDIATIGDEGTDDKSCITSTSSGQKLTEQCDDAFRDGLSSTRFFEEKNKIHLKGDNEFANNTSVPGSDKLDGNVKELLPETTIQEHLQTLLPMDEQQKLNRLLVTAQNRLITAKADMEDVIAKLNQEVAAKQHLTTKLEFTTVTDSQVKDLELELEKASQSSKGNMQHANLVERERFIHVQWDMEEMQKKYVEQEILLKFAQEEKMHAEAERSSTSQLNKVLLQELHTAQEQLKSLQKQHAEEEVKSKADMKLLEKEVKSLRSSQSQLKQELSELKKEKVEVERVLEDERCNMDSANTANAKLLHEFEILLTRLRECSIDFLTDKKDKLTLDTFASDAIDLLKTYDKQICLILAEAQLLAQDIERVTTADNVNNRTNSELRKMLTDIFIHYARLGKEINRVICHGLETNMGTVNSDIGGEEIPLRRTFLSKFLHR